MSPFELMPRIDCPVEVPTVVPQHHASISDESALKLLALAKRTESHSPFHCDR